MSKKLHQNSRDQLSSLPDDLLIKILCTLESYKYAVWCTTLSKRRKDLCKKPPSLYLSDLVPEDYEEESYAPLSNSPAIKALPGHHEVQVRTLVIRTGDHPSNWESFLHTITEHFRKIQNLRLIFPIPWRKSKLIPSSVFSCVNLVTLELTMFDIDAFPEDFKGFPNLRRCVLGTDPNVNPSQFLHLFLRKCPLIEYFELDLHIYWNQEENIMPFVFSSTSLAELVVKLKDSDCKMEFTVIASELSKMEFQYSHYYLRDAPEVKIMVNESPKLARISIPGNVKLIDYKGSAAVVSRPISVIYDEEDLSANSDMEEAEG